MPADVAGIIQLLLTVLSFAIIGRAIMSWFDPGLRSPVGKLLYDVTEPIIAPIRQVVPSLGAIDLSPFVALILIRVLQPVLLSAVD